jgi:hypothetical protein
MKTLIHLPNCAPSRWAALTACLLLVVAPSWTAKADPDLPGASANFELIPAGSLVIAMDNTN